MARTSDDLPGRARADDAEAPVPGFSAKEASCTTTCCSPGGATVMASTARALHGGGSGVFSSSGRELRPSAAADVSSSCPGSDHGPFQWAMGELDRSECGGDVRNRAGDDDPGTCLLLNNQIAANAEHRRLQHHAPALWRRSRIRRRYRRRRRCVVHVAVGWPPPRRAAKGARACPWPAITSALRRPGPRRVRCAWAIWPVAFLRARQRVQAGRLQGSAKTSTSEPIGRCEPEQRNVKTGKQIAR